MDEEEAMCLTTGMENRRTGEHGLRGPCVACGGRLKEDGEEEGPGEFSS